MIVSNNDLNRAKGDPRSVRYAAAAFAVAAGYWVLITLPMLSQRVARSTGVDPMYRALGTTSVWGGHKILAAQALAALLAAILVVLWAVQFRGRGRWLRLAVLVAAIATLGASTIWLDAVRGRFDENPTWIGLSRLAIAGARPLPEHGRRFAKSTFTAEPVRTLEELHRRIQSRFAVDSAAAQSAWPMLEPGVLRTAYMMNVVSNMWAYGNRDEPRRAGCVARNESTGFTVVPVASLTVDEYLASPIGCCDDYAALLKRMLDLSGIFNRLVFVPGHVFNEAEVGGRRITLDATINVLFLAGWEEVIHRRSGRPVSVVTFPLEGEYLGPEWRPSLSRFRLYQLLGAAEGAFTGVEYRETLREDELPRPHEGAVIPDGSASAGRG